MKFRLKSDKCQISSEQYTSGREWLELSNNLSHYIKQVELFHSLDSTLYCFGVSSSEQPIAVSSSDEGVTWAFHSFMPFLYSDRCAISSFKNGNCWSSYLLQEFWSLEFSGIWYSCDNMKTWTLITADTAPVAQKHHSISFFATSIDTLVIAAYDLSGISGCTLSTSKDCGRTWAQIPLILDITHLFKFGSKLFAFVANTSLVSSADNGFTWRPASGRMPRRVIDQLDCVAVEIFEDPFEERILLYSGQQMFEWSPRTSKWAFLGDVGRSINQLAGWAVVDGAIIGLEYDSNVLISCVLIEKYESHMKCVLDLSKRKGLPTELVIARILPPVPRSMKLLAKHVQLHTLPFRSLLEEAQDRILTSRYRKPVYLRTE